MSYGIEFLCRQYDNMLKAAEEKNTKLSELCRDMAELLPLADWRSVEHDEMASQCVHRAEELGMIE